MILRPLAAETFILVLLLQVQSFTQTHPNANADSLYILWAGANDYLQGMTNTALPVANITQAIESLARIGATKMLVANLPDLGQLPATRNSANAKALINFAQSHNLGLRRSLKQLQQQYPQLRIVTLDANALYRQAIAQPSVFGFTNVTQSCCQVLSTVAIPTSFCSGIVSIRRPPLIAFWQRRHPQGWKRNYPYRREKPGLVCTRSSILNHNHPLFQQKSPL